MITPSNIVPLKITKKKKKRNPKVILPVDDLTTFLIDEHLKSLGIKPSHSNRSWIIERILRAELKEKEAAYRPSITVVKS